MSTEPLSCTFCGGSPRISEIDRGANRDDEPRCHAYCSGCGAAGPTAKGGDLPTSVTSEGSRAEDEALQAMALESWNGLMRSRAAGRSIEALHSGCQPAGTIAGKVDGGEPAGGVEPQPSPEARPPATGAPEQDSTPALQAAVDLAADLQVWTTPGSMGKPELHVRDSRGEYFVGRWIPVTERLPENDRDLFVRHQSGRISAGNYDSIREEWDTDALSLWEDRSYGDTKGEPGPVVAWMEIPPLPEER